MCRLFIFIILAIELVEVGKLTRNAQQSLQDAMPCIVSSDFIFVQRWV